MVLADPSVTTWKETKCKLLEVRMKSDLILNNLQSGA